MQGKNLFSALDLCYWNCGIRSRHLGTIGVALAGAVACELRAFKYLRRYRAVIERSNEFLERIEVGSDVEKSGRIAGGPDRVGGVGGVVQAKTA